MSTSVSVTIHQPRACDVCTGNGTPLAQQRPAAYDAKTLFGPWANLCPEHWVEYRATSDLGLGRGQRLVLAVKPGQVATLRDDSGEWDAVIVADDGGTGTATVTLSDGSTAAIDTRRIVRLTEQVSA